MDKFEHKPGVCNSITDKDAGDSVSAIAVHDLQASWSGSMDSLNLDGVSFTISSVSCVVLLYAVIGVVNVSYLFSAEVFASCGWKCGLRKGTGS